MKLLVIEDDEEIVEAISLAFQIRWPEAKVISTRLGQKGVELVETESPNIVILDLGLPDITGFDVLRQIRRFSSVPTIILTVRADEADVVKGLEWGADDYITKPFRQLELLARVKSMIRRHMPAEERSLVFGQLRLDYDTGQHITAKNIVVMATDILGPLDKYGHMSVRTTGSGTAFIFLDGKAIRGSWYRGSVYEPFIFKDSKGNIVPLNGGATWIAMVQGSEKVSY